MNKYFIFTSVKNDLILNCQNQLHLIFNCDRTKFPSGYNYMHSAAPDRRLPERNQSDRWRTTRTTNESKWVTLF